MIIIDGSEGEGGGQVVRNACALSLITGQPFRITNARGKRSKPGLMRQHVTAVEAACALGNATCDGLAVGASDISFTPGKVVPGEYRFAVGTAGSTLGRVRRNKSRKPLSSKRGIITTCVPLQSGTLRQTVIAKMWKQGRIATTLLGG